MSDEDTVKPQKSEIIVNRSFRLLGCVYYGDPFHSEAGWTEENEIGLTWQRFMTIFQKNQELIKKFIVNEDFGYELHIEPDEYKDTKKYYVFVGMEVSEEIEKVPLEMFIKVLPTTMYAVFTFKGKDIIRAGNYIWHNWLPTSDKYKEAFPYEIQAYERKRFFGLNDERSEIDFYIPIKLKQ